MTDLPAIDVVIPAYNAGKYLERSVNSIWQTGYPAVNIYIVDDGSTDNTLDVARRVAAATPDRCFALQHPGGENRGVSQSRNVGISSGKSPWLAFLDADDTYLPNRFEFFTQHVSRIANDSDAHSAVDAIYEMCEIRVDEELESDQRWDVGANPKFGISEPLERMDLLARLMQSDTWAVSAITVKREATEFTGLFDPTLSIAEDCHLWIRLVATRLVIPGTLDRPVSLYFRHGSNSFQFSEANRLNHFASVIDARRKVKDLGAPREVLRAMDDSIGRLARRIVNATDLASRRGIARRILFAAARRNLLFPLMNRQLIRQALW